MPPEAISRSSTYLPKIWGNTRLTHRTALLALWLGAACTTPPPEVTARNIRATWLPECTPAATTGELDLEALGDFDPSPQTHVVVGIDAPDRQLGIPDSTRSVALAADTAQGLFRGVGDLPEATDVTVSLWPTSRACPLIVAGASGYPQDLDGVGFGYSPAESTLLLVGGSSSPASALSMNLASGKVSLIDAAVGPRTPRIGATVTPFGTKLLVAGGSDVDDVAKDTADVFDPASGRFEQDLIRLERRRANHGAVVLASGETLLVGGSNADNQTLHGLEAVSPETRAYRVSGLTSLKNSRANPRVVRLSDDRILVAGGTAEDGSSVDALEWFEPDASRLVQQSTLRTDPVEPQTFDRAFVAMPGGSALAVGGCRIAPSTGCAPCSVGGQAGCASDEVIWVTRDGVPEPLAGALEGATFPTLLVAGSEGRPWLVARSASGRRLLRFDPWLGRFVVRDPAPQPPLAGFETADVPENVEFDARVAAADPGLFVWLTRNTNEAAAAFGYRHDTRGAYANAVVPLLLANQDGVALDRRNAAGLGGLDSNGAVVLNDSGNTLVVTDTTYADVDISIELDASSGTTRPPLVLLGAATYGGAACPWPAAPPADVPARVRRTDRRVSLSFGSKETTCDGPSGRVSVWLRSAGPEVRIRSIDVKRGP